MLQGRGRFFRVLGASRGFHYVGYRIKQIVYIGKAYPPLCVVYFLSFPLYTTFVYQTKVSTVLIYRRPLTIILHP